MKVGDIVRFRFCAQEGELGIVSMLTKPSHVAKNNRKLRLYWVLYRGGNQCFTGNQLEIV